MDMNISLEQTFLEAIDRFLPGFDSSGDILGLAVSGGPDSLALMLLAHKIFPGRIAAATVDHQLRPESRGEAEFVATLCAERTIPHTILSPAVPIRGNIQAEARKARYALFHDWMEREGIAWLATAHHADDQLETLVMRVLRGSGIDGMSGIRGRRGNIVRPLLYCTAKQLQAYVDALGIAAVDDPSNHDNSFDRIRLRKALTKLEGFDARLASYSAAALNEAREALHWTVDEAAKSHVKISADQVVLDNLDFPHEILRRLLLKCLHALDSALSPRGAVIDRAIADLREGKTITVGNILCSGGENWTFSHAPPRKKQP